MKLLFLFGRSPELSKAEIHSLVEARLLIGEVKIEFPDAVMLETSSLPQEVFSRLGGTIRVVELADRVDDFLPDQPSGKFTFGFSYYHVSDWRVRRQRDTASVSNILASKSVNFRFLTARTPELPTASVRGNALVRKGAEFVVFRHGSQELVGRTIFIHDIDSYTSRDRARPTRDPKAGMLPPKLAQIMVNLGARQNTHKIWDPLGGTGVVLQEALLDGYTPMGSDSSTEMVDAMRQNIDWIRSRFSGMPEASIFHHDVKAGWPPEAEGVHCIVTEGYLGKPLSKEPESGYINRLETELLSLYRPLFKSAATRLASKDRIVLCLPFFQAKGKPIRMRIIDDLRSNTYTLRGMYDYAPHGQIVGRQVTVFEKD